MSNKLLEELCYSGLAKHKQLSVCWLLAGHLECHYLPKQHHYTKATLKSQNKITARVLYKSAECCVASCPETSSTKTG